MSDLVLFSHPGNRSPDAGSSHHPVRIGSRGVHALGTLGTTAESVCTVPYVKIIVENKTDAAPIPAINLG